MIFTAADILGFIRRQPFVPLQFVTTNGEVYDIRHPELVVTSQHYVVIGTPSAGNPQIAERTTHVALVHIVEIRTLPITPASPPPNGVAQPA